MRQLALLAVCVLSLGACTSSLVLGTAYNAAAKRTADRVKKYADFDSEQQQWIDQSFQSFQQWHRVSELPVYSSFMKQVVATLKSDQPVTQKQLNQWVDDILERGQRARECSPISGSAEFLSDMASWQIQQLEKKLKSNRLKQFNKYKEETTEERRKRRRETLLTWSSRAGVTMTEKQKQLLDDTLSRQTSMGDRRFQLWEQWTTEFLALLQNRKSEQFPAQIQLHIDSLWNMTERNYPQEWQQNRDLWQSFAQTLLNDLSTAQKNALAGNIASIAKSTNTLSKKSSRSKPVCFAE